MSTRSSSARFLLVLASTGALLAGCVRISPGPPPPVQDLIIQNLVLLSDYRDFNNNPIICDDLPTPMSFQFQYFGDLRQIDISLVGATGARRKPNVTSYDFTRGNGVVYFTVPAGGAPLRVKPEAIIVVPAPVVIGSSTIELTGYSLVDQAGPLNSNAVPIVDNCGSGVPQGS